jgi:hypothetical protein
MLAAYGPLDLAGLWILQSKAIWSRIYLQYILSKFVLLAR